MIKLITSSTAFLLATSLFASAFGGENSDWPGFRGPGGRGIATDQVTAKSWDATNPNDKAILWKTDVPGLGHASPTIIGDKIFLATAVAASGKAPLNVGRNGNIDAADDNGEQTWWVLCYDKATGEEKWRKTARKGDPKATRHAKATHANTTIAADANHVVAFFGSEGLYCYDHEGNLLWQRDLGVINDNPTPTPFVHQDRIYITNAHGGPSPIYAIATHARGNLSESDSAAEQGVVWKVDRGGSYMSTPVAWGDYLYLGNTNGIVRCFHAETGEKVYEERLGSGASITASLVASDDKIYCPSEDGMMYVLQAGPDFKILAENEMGSPCFATPAISDGVLYARTTQTLMAIQSEPESGTKTASPSRPNLLFIAVDDLRPSMGCYGDPRAITPNMDGLAANGVLFNRAYCQVAVCNPSRASLMTGLRPDNLGVWTLPIHFREAMPDAVTMPQWFRKFGYTAVSHGKVYHNPTPDPQSWSEPIRDLRSLPDPYPEGTREAVQAAMKELAPSDWRKNNLRNPSTAAPDLADNELLDGARTDMAIEDLRRLGKQSEPFFLAMGYIRPHLAWVAPKKYWDMHDPSKLPVLEDQHVIPNTPAYAPSNNSELSHYVDLINMPKPWDDEELTLEKRRQLVHGYYACASYVDAQIGRLLNALDEEGLAKTSSIA
ncbi:sulfatase-like hydrolase/transferase [Novipirellula artificiosorum]|uniref:Arylsulfatase n=1 Tax=Novipirellula artificiosorum TaxID=2528016 RepID=A0A5C6D8H7_9BACT|nr:sulfatase-like hydrolase/transferase [Novipirellula artificiosorum]TWU32007.1 Arylsulfatase [Novipirellula artificiosorum]